MSNFFSFLLHGNR